MLKKFGDQIEVWTKYGLFLMRNGRYRTARGLIQRSLKSLTKKQRERNMFKVFLVSNLL